MYVEVRGQPQVLSLRSLFILIYFEREKEREGREGGERKRERGE